MPKRQYVVKGTTFEVDDRYEVKKGVGQGAYGLICAAKDTQSEDQVWSRDAPKLRTPTRSALAPPAAQVAIKKISNAFEDAIDCKRMLREMRLLQHFKHENVLCLKDIMMPNGGRIQDWKDVYLVTELLDTDLHYIIHSKQSLSDDHIQYFVYQVAHHHAVTPPAPFPRGDTRYPHRLRALSGRPCSTNTADPLSRSILGATPAS